MKSKIVFKLVGEMIGICDNCKVIEIIEFNVDGNGNFLYIGDGELKITRYPDDLRKLFEYQDSYKWDKRKYKIENILNET